MTFFSGDRPRCELHYRDRCPEKWGSPNPALGTIANMQCGPQKSMSLTPLALLVQRNISRQKCLGYLFHKINVTPRQKRLQSVWE